MGNIPSAVPTISDKIKWDTLPYSREKAASSAFPISNVAVVLSRSLTYMLTYNIDLGGGVEGKWTYQTEKVLQVNS